MYKFSPQPLAAVRDDERQDEFGSVCVTLYSNNAITFKNIPQAEDVLLSIKCLEFRETTQNNDVADR